jgi:hypothetical protein
MRLITILAFILISGYIYAIQPETLVYTFTKGESSTNITRTLLSNNSYLMTNCVVAGETFSVGDAIQIRCGTLSTSKVFTATIYNTSNFSCLVSFPRITSSGSSIEQKIQLSITNGSTVVTYGGTKIFDVANKLE